MHDYLISNGDRFEMNDKLRRRFIAFSRIGTTENLFQSERVSPSKLSETDSGFRFEFPDSFTTMFIARMGVVNSHWENTIPNSGLGSGNSDGTLDSTRTSDSLFSTISCNRLP